MLILVSGSRDWSSRAAVWDALNRWHKASGTPVTLMHGACPTGADAIADQWASVQHVPVRKFPADWKKYGKSAGPRRNVDMVNGKPDVVLIFCKNYSRGTEHTLSLVQGSAAIVEVHRE